MHIERTGSKEAAAVVLVHGIPGSPRVWEETARALGESHSVLVPHLLGFGQSPSPEDLSADAQAAALADSLDSLGVTKATFVGHDFGGPVLLSLHRERPDLFSGLVLLSTNAFPDTPIPFPLSLVTLPVVGGSLFSRLLFSQFALKQLLRRYGGRELGNPTSVRRIFTDALRHLEETYRDYPDELRRVNVPCTVIWGDEDPFFPVAQGQRTASLIPGADFKVIEGAGHFLPEQRPDDIVGAITPISAIST